MVFCVFALACIICMRCYYGYGLYIIDLSCIFNIIYNYGVRAKAGGTCLVAVLHAASVIGCWGHAAGAASVIVCW